MTPDPDDASALNEDETLLAVSIDATLTPSGKLTLCLVNEKVFLRGKLERILELI